MGNPFGEEIKSLREVQNISLHEMARLTGITRQYISRLERGLRKNPSPDVVKKVSEALGVEPDYLMYLAGHYSYRTKIAELQAENKLLKYKVSKFEERLSECRNYSKVYKNLLKNLRKDINKSLII